MNLSFSVNFFLTTALVQYFYTNNGSNNYLYFERDLNVSVFLLYKLLRHQNVSYLSVGSVASLRKPCLTAKLIPKDSCKDLICTSLLLSAAPIYTLSNHHS